MLSPPCPLLMRVSLISVCHINPPVNFCNICEICVPDHCQNGDIAKQKLNGPTTKKLPADGKCVPCFLHAFDSLWSIQHRLVNGNVKVPMHGYNFHFKAFSVTTKRAVKNHVLQPNTVLILRKSIFSHVVEMFSKH